MARRDEGAYSFYVTEEQRSQSGCIGREGDRLSHSRNRLPEISVSLRAGPDASLPAPSGAKEKESETT